MRPISESLIATPYPRYFIILVSLQLLHNPIKVKAPQASLNPKSLLLVQKGPNGVKAASIRVEVGE